MCVWVYSLFTDVDGDYIKKPMKECTGEEITAEWLYHLGVPVEEIDELAKNHCNTTPTMMPFITAFFMPRRKGDRPDVIPDGCVNFAFLGHNIYDRVFSQNCNGGCIWTAWRRQRCS